MCLYQHPQPQEHRSIVKIAATNIESIITEMKVLSHIPSSQSLSSANI